MDKALKQFTSKTLFEASLSLLDTLKLKYRPVSKVAQTFEKLYKETINNKALKDAISHIKKVEGQQQIFVVGIINSETFLQQGITPDFAQELIRAEEDAKYKGMFIFAVEMDDNLDEKGEFCYSLTRTVCASLTRGFNHISKEHPVTVLIKQGNQLSIATCERSDYKQAGHIGQKVGKVSVLRKINCDDPHRGHLDILKTLVIKKKCKTFDDLYAQWMEVFNSELLTQNFYKDLVGWYNWATKPESHVTFPGDVTTQADDREDINTRIIRMITRLMFVWFIKEKGLVPEKIFEVDELSSLLKDFDPQSETCGNYYQAILQNLFFATLNRPIIDEDGQHRQFAHANSKDSKNLYRYEELFAISEPEVVELFSKVPYLNCGLFECLDKTRTIDGVERAFNYDGFSRNANRFADGTYRQRAVVPNVLFFHKEKGLFSIFNKYVFTIEENTPQDVQVALDPELLGKVFENLLGEFNEETQKEARKQSGSFYTPREIVQYMVNESIISHLKRTVGKELEEQYRMLVDPADIPVALTDDQKKAIMHSLVTCKVLDPACGSGAFPMGILQQMVHILQQVDPDNEMWKTVLLDMAVDESHKAFGLADEQERKKKLLEIEETFEKNLQSPDYTRKLYLIESCIYGVDIQPIAMLISRLRFFITLVCEQKNIDFDNPADNFGIKTLPNLESKFVTANSLFNAEIHKYNEDWTNDAVLNVLKSELLAIRHRHFYTRSVNEKRRLLRQDENKRKEIKAHITRLVGEPDPEKIAAYEAKIAELRAELPQYESENWVLREVAVQLDLFSPVEKRMERVDLNRLERTRINDEIARLEGSILREKAKYVPTGFNAAVLQVTNWNPYDQNMVSPFLDIEWMFGITDGFDIVIGNPPYIQLQKDHSKLANLYQPCGFKTFEKSADIYCLFYERGNQLLRDKGVLCYITSNKWMRAGYGEKLRTYLINNVIIQSLIDFGGFQVFESANIDTCILLCNNSILNDNVEIPSVRINKTFTRRTQIHRYFEENSINCHFLQGETWVIQPDDKRAIIKAIESKGKALKDWEIDINYGIKTGYNPAFIIKTEQRNAILAACSSDEERKRTEELIRPLLRGKDIVAYGNKWASWWLISTFPSMKYDIEQYPQIKKYLQTFTVERLEQTGKEYVIDGVKRKARKKASGKWFETQDSIAYWKDFSKPKIVYPNMTKYMPFYYDEQNYLTNQKCFIITGKCISYLTALFNSSLFKYCFFDKFPTLGEDRRELSKIFFEELPILEVDEKTDEEFHKLILDIQQEYTIEKAKAIDEKIFGLYLLGKTEREKIGFIDFHNSNEPDNEEEEDDDE